MSPTPLPAVTGVAQNAANNQDMFNYLMPLMFLVVGLYMIWRAIIPGGKTFEFAQYKADIRPHMVKTMRIFFIIAGPVCILEAAMDYLTHNLLMTQFEIFYWIVFGLALVLIVGYIVYSIRKYKKYRINP